MRISKRIILSRVTAGLSAAAMCFSMLPMSVIAEDSSMATVGGECIGDMGAIPMLPTVTTGSGDTQLNTGLGHFAFKWSYSYRKTIITNMKNPKQNCVDYTVKVKTKGGQQRTPWDFMTTEQWTMDSQNPYFFDATDTGDTKLMTWLPVLGTNDGQAILDTALALVRHKVNGEGEEVTFDHLIEKIQAIFSNVDLPNDIDDPTRSAFKSVDSEEQQKLINAINEPLGRFIREHQENGIPVNEINFTEKEKNTILDTVTGIM
ncbi:MAG: hypothetical protein IKR76_03665, partial [Ruminococcus sp.]|nr:hypothetical protein [Ruminococcus sp.]